MPQLSQRHQGTLDPDYSATSGMGARLILRPLSVQERIRELNLRARHFAETVLAVQVSKYWWKSWFDHVMVFSCRKNSLTKLHKYIFLLKISFQMQHGDEQRRLAIRAHTRSLQVWILWPADYNLKYSNIDSESHNFYTMLRAGPLLHVHTA